MTKAGAVASGGTIPKTGDRNIAKMKQTAVDTEVIPVRPPAPIPAADSTNVVVFDVPKIAPMIVPIESPNNARSIFELKPEPSSKAFISASVKIPD